MQDLTYDTQHVAGTVKVKTQELQDSAIEGHNHRFIVEPQDMKMSTILRWKMSMKIYLFLDNIPLSV